VEGRVVVERSQGDVKNCATFLVELSATPAPWLSSRHARSRSP